MGSYPLKALLLVYYYFFGFLFKSPCLIPDHLSGLNKVHYYGLCEKVEFFFFSFVSIANTTPLDTSISFSDNWKQGWSQPVFPRSLVVNCFWRAHHWNAKHTAFIAKCWRPWLSWSGSQKAIKEIVQGDGRGGKRWKKPVTEKKIFLYSCSSVY